MKKISVSFSIARPGIRSSTDPTAARGIDLRQRSFGAQIVPVLHAGVQSRIQVASVCAERVANIRDQLRARVGFQKPFDMRFSTLTAKE
jgi:hypothetical protein